MIQIPIGDGVSSFFDESIGIDGVTYTLETRWNVRDESWYMNLLDSEGELQLISGMRLVADSWLASYLVGYGGPDGWFVLYDTSGRAEECTFEGLGSRWKLFFFARNELP